VVFATGHLDWDSKREIAEYYMYDILYKIHSGDWSEMLDYNEPLLDEALKIGEFWHVSIEIAFRTWITTDQGNFHEAQKLLKKQKNIFDEYYYETAGVHECAYKIFFSVKSRNFDNINEILNEGISLANQVDAEGWILQMLGYKAIADILRKDIEMAKETLDEAKRISQNQDFNPPLYIHSYLIGKFLLDLYLFEERTYSNEISHSINYRKEAYRSGKKAINITKKLAPNRVKVLRLMGRYYWLINRQKKATKYWKYAINEGARLNARPDLARTYIEIGKRFLEEKSKYKELNGITAEKYLEMAREMFEEMDLQWDLDELDRIVSHR